MGAATRDDVDDVVVVERDEEVDAFLLMGTDDPGGRRGNAG